MYEQIAYFATAVLTVGIPLIYILRHRAREVRAKKQLAHASTLGLTEPVSLHPRINPDACLATGACVRACPEGEILGLINGRAELIAPTRCIGHGACQAACPVEAITLVFGTERRGVEIPHVTATFETNVGGVYIAGELGGMGLIRNAVTQGREAIDYIAASLTHRRREIYDVAIVGAGPAGLSASLQAMKLGLNFLTFEQDDPGGAILSYPRQKLVMTQPMEIPIYGKFKVREIRKEQLLELWQEVMHRTGLLLNAREKVESVTHVNGYFQLRTPKGEYFAQRVLLAIGRRGTPRRLGVPGENTSRVAYKLIEPEQYQNCRVLVVGGGDSAVEAALSLCEQRRTKVTLSYRQQAFSRLKERNHDGIQHAMRTGAVRVLFESQVKEIGPAKVRLIIKGREMVLPNDYVFVLIGGELPTAFLRSLGIHMEKKFGER